MREALETQIFKVNVPYLSDVESLDDYNKLGDTEFWSPLRAVTAIALKNDNGRTTLTDLLFCCLEIDHTLKSRLATSGRRLQVSDVYNAPGQLGTSAVTCVMTVLLEWRPLHCCSDKFDFSSAKLLAHRVLRKSTDQRSLHSVGN